jgi:hypothetical protein
MTLPPHQIGAAIELGARLPGHEAPAVDIKLVPEAEPAAKVEGEAERVRRDLALHHRQRVEIGLRSIRSSKVTCW